MTLICKMYSGDEICVVRFLFDLRPTDDPWRVSNPPNAAVVRSGSQQRACCLFVCASLACGGECGGRVMGEVVSRRMPFSLLGFTHVARQLQETPQAPFLCGCLCIIVREGFNTHMADILALPSSESVAPSAVPQPVTATAWGVGLAIPWLPPQLMPQLGRSRQ